MGKCMHWYIKIWFSKLLVGLSRLKLQNAKVAKLQSAKAAKCQSCKMPKLQGAKVAKIQSCKVPKCRSCKVPKLQNAKVATCQSYKVPKLQSTRVTKCQYWQVPKLQNPKRVRRGTNHLASYLVCLFLCSYVPNHQPRVQCAYNTNTGYTIKTVMMLIKLCPRVCHFLLSYKLN